MPLQATPRPTVKQLFIGLVLLILASLGHAADERFTVVRVDTAIDDLRMFWRDERGAPFGRLDRLAQWLQAQQKQLAFGMNAGMYEADSSPVGLLVIDGIELSPLNLASKPGNFFLKPNGVFLVDGTGPQVMDAVDYRALKKTPRRATQSGPLLLKQGAIHPKLNPNSNSRLIRNGVGVAGSQAIFVISEKPVSLHEFAVFFRDTLHCQNALYLDGTISSLYSADLHRADAQAARPTDRRGPLKSASVSSRPKFS